MLKQSAVKFNGCHVSAITLLPFKPVLFKPLYLHTQANQAQWVSGISQCTWGCGITTPQCHTFGAKCGA